MADVLEEITESKIDAAHVIRRIEDWVHRINDLYAAVETWLPSGWRAKRSRSVQMNEEMMRRFGVPPRRIDTLDLWHGSDHRGSIEPRGLWIIGANGRLDLRAGSRHFVIIDKAENFMPAAWHLADFNDRQCARVLDQLTFEKAIEA